MFSIVFSNLSSFNHEREEISKSVVKAMTSVHTHNENTTLRAMPRGHEHEKRVASATLRLLSAHISHAFALFACIPMINHNELYIFVAFRETSKKAKAYSR
jgi:hypothetical protein